MAAWPVRLRRTLGAVSLALVAIHPDPAFALQPKAEPSTQVFHHKIWQPEDGLPHPVTRAILQAGNGYVWASTWEGIARFDGQRFETFLETPASSMRDRQWLALAETRDGSLWASTPEGLARLTGGQTIHFTKQDGLPSSHVLVLYQDVQNTLWAGTTNGLAQYRDGKFEPHPGVPRLSIRDVTEDETGILWVGTSRGLCRIKDGSVTVFDSENHLPSLSVQCLAVGRDGVIWVGTARGLVRWKDNSPEAVYSTQDGLLHNTVRALHEDQHGRLWVGTFGGLQLLENQVFKPVLIQGDRSDDFSGTVPGFVFAIHEDREGNIWAGTSEGLNLLRAQPFKTYSRTEGLTEPRVTTVCERQAGGLWIGTWGGGLLKMDSGTLEEVQVARGGIASRHILALHEDAGGTLWIGTDGLGLFELNNEKIRRHGPTKGLTFTVVKALHQDRSGRLWIGCEEGLGLYHNGRFTNHTNFHGFPMLTVRSILEDRKGVLWFGTRNGLCRLDGSRFQVFTTANGLPDNMVTALHEDEAGILWIGTQFGGLTSLSDGRIVSHRPAAETLGMRISNIQEDGHGNLWMGTHQGIIRVSRADLLRFADGADTRVEVTVFGKDEGMKNAQCNGIAQPSAIRTPDGHLWFATINGLATVNPGATIGREKDRLPIVIERVLVNDEPADLTTLAKGIPVGAGELEVQFTAMNFIRPDKVEFSYKLEGIDQKWQPAQKLRTARYNNLPPGRYKFRLKAEAVGTASQSAEVTVAVNLLPQFHQTAAFYWLCLPGGIVLGLLARRVILWKARRHQKALESLVDLRTRELQSEITERHQAENRATILSQLGEKLGKCRTSKDAADIILETAGQFLPWDAFTCATYDPAEDRLNRILYVDTFDGARKEVTFAQPATPISPIHRKALTGGPQLLLRTQPGDYSENCIPFGNTARLSASLMFVPFIHEDKVVGIMSLQSYTPNAYDEKALSTFADLAAHCSGALDRIRAARQTLDQARLLNLAQDGIVEISLRKTLLFQNEAARALLETLDAGTSTGKVVGPLCPRFPQVKAAWKSVLRTGECHAHIELPSTSGQAVFLDTRWTLVRNAAGRPHSVLVLATDITEKKKLEQHFLRAQRVECIGTLASGVAHDLNNILTPIMMGASLIRNNGLPDGESTRMIRLIEDSAKRGADIIQHLLTFAKGVGGERIQIDLRRLLGDLTGMLRETFPRNISIKLDNDAAPEGLVADPTQLHQVLMNVCINARDAMPRGGTLLITLASAEFASGASLPPDTNPGRYGLIRIEDTGTGIPPEIINRIFDPFFTTKGPRNGTGLGLSSTMGIVRNHGGFITVSSRMEAGTSFYIYFPLLDAASPHIQSQATEPTPPRGNGKCVLVVDDEESVLEATREVLEQHGYSVITARNGAEGLAKLNENRERIDVIITDLAMPVMDGSAFVKALRRASHWMPVIVVSGHMDKATLLQVDRLGVSKFLPKPYPFPQLLKVLAETLAARPTQQLN